MPPDASTAPTISVLRPGQDVDGVFACTRKDRLMTRTGSPYLALELRDRTRRRRRAGRSRAPMPWPGVSSGATSSESGAAWSAFAMS